MPTRPNNQINPSTGTVTAHDGTILSHNHTVVTAPEELLDVTQPINLTGAVVVNVGCGGCNPYAAERITIPYPVIYEALLEDPFDAATRAAYLADERIVAERHGVENPPSRHFKMANLEEAAATMRNQALIPFSPFVREEVAVSYRTQAGYLDWVALYETAVNP